MRTVFFSIGCFSNSTGRTPLVHHHCHLNIECWTLNFELSNTNDKEFALSVPPRHSAHYFSFEVVQFPVRISNIPFPFLPPPSPHCMTALSGASKPKFPGVIASVVADGKPANTSGCGWNLSCEYHTMVKDQNRWEFVPATYPKSKSDSTEIVGIDHQRRAAMFPARYLSRNRTIQWLHALGNVKWKQKRRTDMRKLGLFAYLVAACHLLALVDGGTSSSHKRKVGFSDYCVIGAGPAGIQMAHFLQKASLNYIVFERDWGPASTFRKYPRHGRLISINKRYTGRNSSESKANREYNLRHDWHSFLTATEPVERERGSDSSETPDGGGAFDDHADDDGDEILSFSGFSERYFPLSEEYIAYVAAFIRQTKPRIRFGRNVVDVSHVKRNHSANARFSSPDGDDRQLYHFQLRVQQQARLQENVKKNDKNAQAQNAEQPPNESPSKPKQRQTRWFCKRLLVASGMQKETVPWWDGVELTTTYGTHDTDPTTYRNKSVAVVGGGNSAFEIIKSIMGEAASIHQYARHKTTAEESHYPGALRSANSAALDNEPVLRTQDKFFQHPFPLRNIRIREEQYRGERKVCILPSDDGALVSAPKQALNSSWEGEVEGGGDWLFSAAARESRRPRYCYDYVIRCLGFSFDPSVMGRLGRKLNFQRQNGIPKYPSITQRFEAEGISHLYFIGSNAHSLDFKLSSGGLVHGFRYQILNLFRHLRRRYHGVPWPQKKLTLGHDLKEQIVSRYAIASSLYQMFEVQCDVAAIISREGQGEVVYFYGVLTHDIDAFLKDMFAPAPPPTEYITLSFEFMPEIDNQLVWGDDGYLYASDNPVKPHNNQSVEAYTREELVPRATAELYLLEDLRLEYQNPVLHLGPLGRFLERVGGAPIDRPDPEFSMSWFCDWCDDPDPSWRAALRKRCGDDRETGVCQALAW
eukprot:jgi/Bigna1/78919/fgenesh1_pg.58_\